MTEAYPWGAQAPAKRVSTLETQIASNDTKRSAALSRHRDEIKKFDEIEKNLKSDLRNAQTILEKERAEANAAAAANVLAKLLKSSGVDVDEAIRDGTLENAMTEALAKVSGSKSRRKAQPKTDGDAS